MVQFTCNTALSGPSTVYVQRRPYVPRTAGVVLPFPWKWSGHVTPHSTRLHQSATKSVFAMFAFHFPLRFGHAVLKIIPSPDSRVKFRFLDVLTLYKVLCYLKGCSELFRAVIIECNWSFSCWSFSSSLSNTDDISWDGLLSELLSN